MALKNIDFPIFIVMRAEKILILLFFILALLVLNFLIPLSFGFLFLLLSIFLIYLKFHTHLKAKLRLSTLARSSRYFTGSNAFLKLCDIGLSDYDFARINREIASNGEAKLAEIDQDGFYLPIYEMNLHLPLVPDKHFMQRHKHKISLVALDAGIAIRKDFGRNYILFSNEIIALRRLSGCCNTPTIFQIDYKNHVLYVSYILGATIRELISAEGAKILDRDIVSQENREKVTDNERHAQRIAEGKKYLKDAVGDSTIHRIFEKISEIHERGVCLYDIKYGNIIIEERTKEPYFIDFENSIIFNRASGFLFEKMRNYDLRLLNLHFG